MIRTSLGIGGIGKDLSSRFLLVWATSRVSQYIYLGVSCAVLTCNLLEAMSVTKTCSTIRKVPVVSWEGVNTSTSDEVERLEAWFSSLSIADECSDSATNLPRHLGLVPKMGIRSKDAATGAPATGRKQEEADIGSLIESLSKFHCWDEESPGRHGYRDRPTTPEGHSRASTIPRTPSRCSDSFMMEPQARTRRTVLESAFPYISLYGQGRETTVESSSSDDPDTSSSRSMSLSSHSSDSTVPSSVGISPCAESSECGWGQGWRLSDLNIGSSDDADQGNKGGSGHQSISEANGTKKGAGQTVGGEWALERVAVVSVGFILFVLVQFALALRETLLQGQRRGEVEWEKESRATAMWNEVGWGASGNATAVQQALTYFVAL